MTPVVTEGLTKDYGRTRALDGLDLEVRAGEIFGFLGPNGAGKTTTIRLLLDVIRPTAGLDPLKQHDFLALLREARDAGQTVFMSSHVLSEVQHVADRVGIIREGQLVAVEGMEALRERAMRRVRITFDQPVPVEAFQGLPEVNDLHIDGATLTCRVAGRPDALVKAAARFTVTSLTAEEADLEELFFAYYRSGGESNAA